MGNWKCSGAQHHTAEWEKEREMKIGNEFKNRWGENEGGRRRREEKSTRVFHTLPRRLWLWLFRFIHFFFIFSCIHTETQKKTSRHLTQLPDLTDLNLLHVCIASVDAASGFLHRNGFWLPFVTVSSDNRQVFNFTPILMMHSTRKSHTSQQHQSWVSKKK